MWALWVGAGDVEDVGGLHMGALRGRRVWCRNVGQVVPPSSASAYEVLTSTAAAGLSSAPRSVAGRQGGRIDSCQVGQRVRKFLDTADGPDLHGLQSGILRASCDLDTAIASHISKAEAAIT